MDIQRGNKNNNAEFGDIILCDNNRYYMLLMNDEVDSKFPTAILDIRQNSICMTTQQKELCVGGTLGELTIYEIIPKNKARIIID